MQHVFEIDDGGELLVDAAVYKPDVVIFMCMAYACFLTRC